MTYLWNSKNKRKEIILYKVAAHIKIEEAYKSEKTKIDMLEIT